MTYGNGQGQPKDREPVERVLELFVHTPIGLAVMAWKRVPGLVSSVPELVGQAVAKGCAQLADVEVRLSEEVRKARMIGQVAVTFGGRQLRREVDARLRDARQAAGGVASFVPGLGGDSNGAGTASKAAAEPGAAKQAAKPAATAAGKPATKAAGARKATKTSTAKASRVTKAAKASTAKASGATKRTKASTAKAAGATKRTRRPSAPASAADLPIREYDGLSASQVVSRLSGLSPEELRAIRSYEEGSRGRRTVLLAIDRLLD